MSRTILALTAFTFLSTSTAHASPQLDFDEIFGGANSTCSGTSLAGHCCPGSIVNPSGDFANNNDVDLSGVVCCVGDPSHSFNNGGASTCSAGRAVPLTEVSGAATASAAAGSASAVASTSVGVGRSSAVVQSSVAPSAQATQTGSAGSGAESGSAASSAVPAQSSVGGAGVVMATLVPALGGVVIGVAGIL